MKHAARTLELENRNIGWKNFVHPALQFRRLLAHFRFDLKVHHLPQCVNSGIGPAGALHFKFSGKDLACGLAQFSHHGASVVLILPAAIPGAVVFENEFECDH
jgi:hypothetical protein